MTISGENSYLGHIFQDVGHTYSSNIRLICAGAVPTHNPRKEIPHITAIAGFKQMAAKRQNLQTAALKL